MFSNAPRECWLFYLKNPKKRNKGNISSNHLSSSSNLSTTDFKFTARYSLLSFLVSFCYLLPFLQGFEFSIIDWIFIQSVNCLSWFCWSITIADDLLIGSQSVVCCRNNFYPFFIFLLKSTSSGPDSIPDGMFTWIWVVRITNLANEIFATRAARLCY